MRPSTLSHATDAQSLAAGDRHDEPLEIAVGQKPQNEVPVIRVTRRSELGGLDAVADQPPGSAALEPMVSVMTRSPKPQHLDEAGPTRGRVRRRARVELTIGCGGHNRPTAAQHLVVQCGRAVGEVGQQLGGLFVAGRSQLGAERTETNGFVDLFEGAVGSIVRALGEAPRIKNIVELLVGELTCQRSEFDFGQEPLEELLDGRNLGVSPPRHRREALDDRCGLPYGVGTDGGEELVKVDGAECELGAKALALLLTEEGLGGLHHAVVQVSVTIEAIFDDGNKASGDLGVRLISALSRVPRMASSILDWACVRSVSTSRISLRRSGRGHPSRPGARRALCPR